MRFYLQTVLPVPTIAPTPFTCRRSPDLASPGHCPGYFAMERAHIRSTDSLRPRLVRLPSSDGVEPLNALQYSVFACDLSSKERVILEEALTDIINLKEDRVIIIDIGPVEGRGGDVMRTLGRQTKPRQREALVV